MLQQTKVETVIPYYIKWIKKYPDIKSVALENTNSLLKYWEGLGYYRRCINIHKTSKIITNKYKGIIPKDYKTFLSLPGIGEYTAGAVFSIAFKKPYPAIDVNAKRVFSRIIGIKRITKYNLNRIKKTIITSMRNSNPGDFNQAIMELGSMICSIKAPKCTLCPIKTFCKAFSTSNPNQYPAQKKIKTKPHYDVVIAVIWNGKQFFIKKRPINKMLGGLWEFPGGKIEKDETKIEALKREIKEECNAKPVIKSKVGIIKHSYSHFSVSLHCYNCVISKKNLINIKNSKWITSKEIDKFPFPKANHKIFELLKNYGWNL